MGVSFSLWIAAAFVVVISLESFQEHPLPQVKTAVLNAV
jgi:hypothetical protein